MFLTARDRHERVQARFIYSPHYDFSLLGLERLHPFDAHKFSRAWAIVQGHLGAALPALWLQPEGLVSDTELLRVHTAQYLQSLRSSDVVARALELWPAKFLPNALWQQTASALHGANSAEAVQLLNLDACYRAGLENEIAEHGGAIAAMLEELATECRSFYQLEDWICVLGM